MDKQQLADKATEALRPFETENLITTLQNLTLKEIFTHPVILIIIIAVLFFGLIKKSKVILLSLFSLIGLIVLIRFALPAPGEELTFSSLLPFVGVGLVVGVVIIYFSLIKSE